MSSILATTATRTAPETPTISVKPLTLSAPSNRGQDLQVRVTAPTGGDDLPVILFSHGMTLTMHDYSPLADVWAAHGFVVVQPTHLDSLGLAPDDPRNADLWRIRVQDLITILDQLDTVAAAVPGLGGRIDPGRVVAAGHSWGAQTASMLAGARVNLPGSSAAEDISDARIRAAVLLCLAGTGGANLTPLATQYFPFMNPDFTHLTTPSLMVAGDHDQSPLSVRGPDWFTDGYGLCPGVTDLVVLYGAEHGLGGIHGSHDTRTTDESPERVSVVQHATLAWLRSAIGLDTSAWAEFKADFAATGSDAGRIESKTARA